tara:strand:+ start:7682 stop:11431 length:3750 start_codon:yes stop_codon:yes gene_type:complete
MITQISKPGVEIKQVFSGTPVTPSVPTLIPCIVGPAFEVVDLLNEDGTPSSTSLVETSAGPLKYSQLPISIETSDFPTPKADPQQMTVLDEEVTAGISVAGALDELDLSPGSAFLCDLNIAQRAGIHFKVPNPINGNVTIGGIKFTAVAAGAAGDGITITITDNANQSAAYDAGTNTVSIAVDFSSATHQNLITLVEGQAPVAAIITASSSTLNALVSVADSQDTAGSSTSGITTGTLILALDNITRQSVADDYYIETVNNESAASLAAKINTAVGEVIASAETVDNIPGLLIRTNRYGVAGSITIRKASGNFVSTFVSDISAGLNSTLRVEGAGLVAVENTVQGVTTSSWVRFSQGAVFNDDLVNNISTADINDLENNNDIRFVQINSDGTIKIGEADDVDFKNELLIRSASPSNNGDLFFASGPFGQSLSSVMVTAVEPTKFKLGVVDTLRSEYDASGNPVNQRYIDFSLGELTSNPTPFAPKNGFVIAQNLTSWLTSDDIVIGTHGPAQAVSADITNSLVAATAASVSFSNVTNAAITASVGLSIVVSLVVDGVTTAVNFLIEASHDNANLDDSLNAVLTGITTTLDTNTNVLTFTATEARKEVSIRVAAGATGSPAILQTVNSGNLVNNGYEDIGTDEVFNLALVGKTLDFTFNNSRRDYSVVSTSQSLFDFIRDVNDFVGFSVLTRITSKNNVAGVYLQLRSPLIGIASSVIVNTGIVGSIGEALFANYTTDSGEGRPNPDAYVMSGGKLLLSPEILRNPISGQPLNNATVSGDIHIGYRALRLDLTASANQPGLIKISNVEDLETIYGPVSIRNPLALALYYALINAGSGTEISALGVDDISESEPEGTTLSYKAALEYLRTFEVYSLCPLSSSEDVIQLFNLHVTDMSSPSQRAERIFVASPKNPIRRNDEVILSSGAVGAESTGNAGQIDLNVSPESLLAAKGIDTSAEVPFELDSGNQLFVQLTIGDDSYKYSVISVDGARVTVRYTYTTAQNGDNFYSTETLPTEFSNASFSLALRGTVLTLPGSTKLDKTAYAETVRDKAQQYSNRRQLRLHPDTVQSSAVGGVNQSLPSYYYGAAIVGAVSFIEPQEPFTRLPFVGFNDVRGPSLERSHLDIISAGNAHIEVDVAGQLPTLRIQSTTDPSVIESREFSVTKAVDSFAKLVRAQLKSRIGKFNITQQYIDDLTILVDSMCTTATQNGLFRSATVSKLEQDRTQPDTILVEIQLEVLYPANYIKLTLVV